MTGTREHPVPVSRTARLPQPAPGTRARRDVVTDVPVSDLPPGASPRLHDLARWIGTLVLPPGAAGAGAPGERIPVTGPVVVVANHSAFVDGPLLFGLVGRRMVFLTKQEMFRGPLGWLLPRIGQLAVRRGRAGPGAAACGGRGAAGRRDGRDLPRGHPRRRRRRGRAAGAAWLARATGARVLPVVARGTRRDAGLRRRFRPRVDVLVGEPLTVAPGGGRAGLTTATETIRAALAGLVVELDEVRSNSE